MARQSPLLGVEPSVSDVTLWTQLEPRALDTEAARLGIPVEPRTRTAPPAPVQQTCGENETPSQYVCVIGGRAVPDADPQLERWTARLADRGAVHFLEARFRKGRLIWAGCWPDPSRPEISQALTGYFT